MAESLGMRERGFLPRGAKSKPHYHEWSSSGSTLEVRTAGPVVSIWGYRCDQKGHPIFLKSTEFYSVVLICIDSLLKAGTRQSDCWDIVEWEGLVRTVQRYLAYSGQCSVILSRCNDD